MRLLRPNTEDRATWKACTLSRDALAESWGIMLAVIVTPRGAGGTWMCRSFRLVGGGSFLLWRCTADVSTVRSLGGSCLGPWRRQHVGRPRRRWEES